MPTYAEYWEKVKRKALSLTLNLGCYQGKEPTIFPPVLHSNISDLGQWNTSRAMHIPGKCQAACCPLSLCTKHMIARDIPVHMIAKDYWVHGLEEYRSRSSQLNKPVQRVQLASGYCNRSVSRRTGCMICISTGNYSSLWASGKCSWNISVSITFHPSNKPVTGKFFWKAIELGSVYRY